MKLSRLRNRWFGAIAIILFLSLFIETETVLIIEISARYPGDKTTYTLPSGEKIVPEYGKNVRLQGISFVSIARSYFSMDEAILFKNASKTKTAQKELSLSLRPISDFKKSEISLAVVGLSLTKKKSKPLVLVTGVGIKPINYIFQDITTGQPVHTEVVAGDRKYKANIGAATAYELCNKGYEVLMIARTEEKLKIVQQWIQTNLLKAVVDYSAISISNQSAIKSLLKKIPKEKTIFWVQSVGLGGGTVKIKDNNPYLAIDKISPELMRAELTVLTDTVKMLQILLPRFRKQQETRVCIVSSMSAVRSAPYASIHNAAKGSISRFANAAMLELDREKIYFTDVRPGVVDTGMYDSLVVQDVIRKIVASMNYDWSEANGGLRLAPPSSVGKLIAEVLSSEAHITSINLVARGQFPHEGS